MNVFNVDDGVDVNDGAVVSVVVASVVVGFGHMRAAANIHSHFVPAEVGNPVVPGQLCGKAIEKKKKKTKESGAHHLISQCSLCRRPFGYCIDLDHSVL